MQKLISCVFLLTMLLCCTKADLDTGSNKYTHDLDI